MKKKLNKKTIRIIILLSVIFLTFNVINSKQPKEVRVKDYMPNKPMVKIFNGGFEGAGSVEIIDKIKGEFYQKKTLDTATMGVAVYRVNKEGYILVYREGETSELKDDYIDEKSNNNLILLRSPIKKGVSWINDDKSTYKILSVDEKMELMGEEIEAVKLRYRKDGYEYYIYFAEGFGIIGIESEMGNSKLIEVKYDVEKYLSKPIKEEKKN
jgi:transcriptional antiterminator Rof (Rho-off)